MGVQEKEARPQRRDGTARALRRCVGKSAASSRLRYRPFHHPYSLDQHGSETVRDRTRRSRAAGKTRILWAVFHDPERLRPKETRAGLTKEAADKFSTIALRLQGRRTPGEVDHFVNQLVF